VGVARSVVSFLPERDIGSYSGASKSTIESLPLTARSSYTTCRPVICFGDSLGCIFLGGRIKKELPPQSSCLHLPVPQSFKEKNFYLLNIAKGFLKLFLRMKSVVGSAPTHPRSGWNTHSVSAYFLVKDRVSEFDSRNRIEDRASLDLSMDGIHGPDGFGFHYKFVSGYIECGYTLHGYFRGSEVSTQKVTVWRKVFNSLSTSYSFNPLQNFSLQGTPEEEAVLEKILGDALHLGNHGEEIRGSVRVRHIGDQNPSPERPVLFRYMGLGDILGRSGSTGAV
jgi:hypothetical protein